MPDVHCMNLNFRFKLVKYLELCRTGSWLC